MPFSKKNQTILSLIAAIAWFIAGGLLIGISVPIGISFLVFGFVFVALTVIGYKRTKNQS
jgi:hypothetical protein